MHETTHLDHPNCLLCNCKLQWLTFGQINNKILTLNIEITFLPSHLKNLNLNYFQSKRNSQNSITFFRNVKVAKVIKKTFPKELLIIR
jgi:hypothetical protein